MTESPPEPRLSATVILVRDGDHGGVEVFMVRRHERSHLSSAYVFPGGTLRDDDQTGPWAIEPLRSRLSESLNNRTDGEPFAPGVAPALFACAMRELFEEAGVLLVAGRYAVSADGLAQARQDLQAEKTTLARVLAQWSARPDFEALVPFSRWITPPQRPQRFDTAFFLARMPDEQTAAHCAIETTDGVWLRAEQVIEMERDGAAVVLYPTLARVRRIAPYKTVAALLEFAQHKRIVAVRPALRTSPNSGQPEPWIPASLEDSW